ncbi:MAG: wax ester/triacylglycerol synthase family O-acyltransferase [Mycobacteriales bacterium]
MQRMSPQDASFLHIEDDNTHMHIGSVVIFEGPPPAYEELCRHITGKLPLVPRYRQKVRLVPLELGRPVWVDDPHFNLGYHLRQTALGRPGGDEQLRTLMGRVMSQQLDRSRPMWEMWIVEGLEDDHWALISKLHHSMVDGVSATDLLTVLMDAEPEPEPPVPDDWAPESEPSRVRLVADAVVDRIVSPYEQVRGLQAALRAPREAAELMSQTARGALSLAGLARPTIGTSLSGPIGPHRRWGWARTSLAEVKLVRTALGGTVNDVILATITGGFRALLLGRDEPVEGTVVRSLVPVSVRRPTERSTPNNRVSAMFAELPVGLADPVERLHSISGQMKDLKESKQAVAGEMLTSMAGFAPPMLLAMGTRLAMRVPQRNVNTVTTNVPGPQRVVYAVGRRMLEVFPFVPLGGNLRIGVAIVSYNGRLNVGVTGDYDTAPDIDVLCRGIEESMAELVKAAESAAPADGA